jgi:[acyl-carrier-protein] S-malonyltransferase
MARALCDSLPAARALFDQAAQILGYDLLEVCASGPVEVLNSTVVCQPALYVASLAALESLRTTEPEALHECVATAGLSLGEYTALTFAGVLTFADGLRLVQRRGEAMQAASEASAGTMYSLLGLERAKVEELCAAQTGMVKVANVLCPGNLVVSGKRDACEAVAAAAEAAGARTMRLAVAGAFHTPLMQPAVAALTEALAGVKLGEMRVSVWANVTARPYENAEQVRELLARQVVEPVLWEQTMRALLESGCDRFYEIGPGRVLAGLLKRVQRKVDCRNVTP